MKKFLVSVVILLSLISGCATNNKIIKNNVSEIRLNEWEYSSEEYYISFSSGKREDPYIIDGEKGKMIDYGIVKLVFYDIENNDKIDKFLLIIDDREYSIILEQNPFDNSLMGDIKYCPSKKASVKVNFVYDEKIINNELKEFIEYMPISNQKALKIFLETYKNKINKDNLKGEIHITILENVKFNKTIKYWYIAYFCNEKNFTCCIDTISGAVLKFM